MLHNSLEGRFGIYWNEENGAQNIKNSKEIIGTSPKMTFQP